MSDPAAGTSLEVAQNAIVKDVETKYFDSEYGLTNVAQITTTWASTNADPTTGSQACLFAPTQGTTKNSRSGNKVKVTGLRINARIRCPAQTSQTTPDNGGLVRVILFLNRDCNGAQVTGDKVIAKQGATVTFTDPNALFGFMNANSCPKIKILRDKTFTFHSPSGTYDGSARYQVNGITKHFEWRIKYINGLDVQFKANAGVVADITDNSFHIIAGSNLGTTVNDLNPKLGYVCRVYFKDV